MFRQQATSFISIFRADVHYFVNNRSIVVFRNKVRANTLQFVGSSRLTFQHRGSVRFYSNNFNGRVLFFQEFCRTGKSTASTNAGNYYIHLTIGVPPNFRTGSFIMSLGVRPVIELSGNKSTFHHRRQFHSFVDGTLHAKFARSKHQLCPISFQQIATLYTHSVRHSQNSLVTFNRRHASKTYAGIATGRFNDSATSF